MYQHRNENNPSSGDVFSYMCSSGCLLPASTSGVERGFSSMNLIVTSLQTNLNQANINRFMHISVNGPEHFTDTQMEQ